MCDIVLYTYFKQNQTILCLFLIFMAFICFLSVSVSLSLDQTGHQTWWQAPVSAELLYVDL